MNKLILSTRVISSELIHGIQYRDSAILLLSIDGKSVYDYGDFTDCFPVLSELQRSLSTSGKFLFMTCACGVADDAGLSGVEVLHRGGSVSWQGDGMSFVFDFDQYRNEIGKCVSEVEKLPKHLTLEPISVVYPEDWGSS